jgi:hypothetical protein
MNPQVHEISRDDSHLTNHQRIKDREMQRSFDVKSDDMLTPTSGRARRNARRNNIQKQTNEEQSDAASLPMQDTPDN